MKRLLTLFLLGVQVAHAQKSLTDEILNVTNGTRLEIRSVFDPMPPTGYAPLRIVATNGAARDNVWKFDFSSQTQDYRRNNSHISSLVLPVPARSTQSAMFLAPLAANYGDNSGYSSGGHTFTVTLTAPVSQIFPSYDDRVSDFSAIAISKALADGSMDSLKDELEKRRKSASSYSRGVFAFGSRFTPEDLPEDWRAFSGFDYIMLTDSEWGGLKSGVQNALLQWVRLGGRLHFYRTSGAVTGLPPDDKTHSLGQIERFTWNGTKLSAVDTVARYWNGTQRFHDLMAEHTGIPEWSLLSALGKRSFNSWQVVVFLVIFGILVGPVNLFILAPSGQRHRLFVTTPLLSLGASVAMIGIILLQDGIGGIGVRYLFINLVPEEAAAYVTQKQASRTGVLFGSGFELKQPALIEPLTLPDSEWVKLKNTNDSQPISLTQNGPARGGNFFQSRAEQAQMIRAAISTRARLEVQPNTEPDSPPTVVSALGFTVDEMFYLGADGVLWSLKSPLVTGQKADLIKVESKVLNDWWDQRKKSSKMPGLQNLIANPKNHFFATAKAAPDFTQDTLSSVRWQNDEIVVYGSVTPP